MMKAVNKYILIDEIRESVTTSSGILLSADDVNDIRYGKAKIISAGINVETMSEGDFIYYDKRAEYKVILDGEKYGIIQERDVIVIV
jgi:co-chaperonin GroES (HSP10)